MQPLDHHGHGGALPRGTALPGDPHTAVLLRQVVTGDHPHRITATCLDRRLCRWQPPRAAPGAGQLVLSCWRGAVVADHGTSLRWDRELPAHTRNDFVLEISDHPFTIAPGHTRHRVAGHRVSAHSGW